MAAKLSYSNVRKAAETIWNTYQEWRQSEVPSDQPRQVKTVSQLLDDTIRRQCDATADEGKEVEPSARGLMLVIDGIAVAHRKFVRDASNGIPVDPSGSPAWHRALGHLESVLAQQDFKQPPPIALLREQGVSPMQIARIYGWKNKDGSPDTDKVFEEIEKPGRHYDAKKWVHPSLRVIQEEADREWQGREPRPRFFALQNDGTELDEAGKPVAAKPAEVPSIEELIQQKAPIAQIVRLHKISETDVLELAEAMGVNLLERDIKPATYEASLQEQLTNG